MKIVSLMENTSCSPSLHAEHGLSLYIETQGVKILFDAGQSDLFSENAAQLGVPLEQVDMAVLSHGHYDHSGGLQRFLEINDHACIYMNRGASGEHWSGDDHYIGIDRTLMDSGRIVLTDDEMQLTPFMRLLSCNGRQTKYPSSGQGLTIREGNIFTQDAFLHEQYLEITENGRRILISGCSHKGILNIMDWMQPDVLVGGFHFMKIDPATGADALRQAARTLLSWPAEYYTGHCTGASQFDFLKTIMGERLHDLSAGTEINL